MVLLVCMHGAPPASVYTISHPHGLAGPAPTASGLKLALAQEVFLDAETGDEQAPLPCLRPIWAAPATPRGYLSPALISPDQHIPSLPEPSPDQPATALHPHHSLCVTCSPPCLAPFCSGGAGPEPVPLASLHQGAARPQPPASLAWHDRGMPLAPAAASGIACPSCACLLACDATLHAPMRWHPAIAPVLVQTAGFAAAFGAAGSQAKPPPASG